MHLMKKNIISQTTYTIILSTDEVELIRNALAYYRSDTMPGDNMATEQHLTAFFNDMLKA